MRNLFICGLLSLNCLVANAALAQREVLCEKQNQGYLMTENQEVVATVSINSSAIIKSEIAPKYMTVQYLEISVGDKICRFELVDTPETILSLQEEENTIKSKILKLYDKVKNMF